MRRLLVFVVVGVLLWTTTAYAVSENAPHAEHQTSNIEKNNVELSHHQQTIHTETPPNYRVLSVFAIVNALFLLIGIMLKLRLRRGRVML